MLAGLSTRGGSAPLLDEIFNFKLGPLNDIELFKNKIPSMEGIPDGYGLSCKKWPWPCHDHHTRMQIRTNVTYVFDVRHSDLARPASFLDIAVSRARYRIGLKFKRAVSENLFFYNFFKKIKRVVWSNHGLSPAWSIYSHTRPIWHGP